MLFSPSTTACCRRSCPSFFLGVHHAGNNIIAVLNLGIVMGCKRERLSGTQVKKPAPQRGGADIKGQRD